MLCDWKGKLSALINGCLMEVNYYIIDGLWKHKGTGSLKWCLSRGVEINITTLVRGVRCHAPEWIKITRSTPFYRIPLRLSRRKLFPHYQHWQCDASLKGVNETALLRIQFFDAGESFLARRFLSRRQQNPFLLSRRLHTMSVL